ncbi:hypothetical protein G6O67_004993 [Ophiocordyceps sinensis]|uniref:Uncharacterized protein n=1 Tax=Ophiocordyceps sinensis TaxID=72228 RepID=A0A8H4V5N0_9HYPO|nr:hypothetical protein G6O67_004993 [Ophiocordyceps sinensis]
MLRTRFGFVLSDNELCVSGDFFRSHNQYSRVGCSLNGCKGAEDDRDEDTEANAKGDTVDTKNLQKGISLKKRAKKAVTMKSRRAKGCRCNSRGDLCESVPAMMSGDMADLCGIQTKMAELWITRDETEKKIIKMPGMP